MKLPTIQEAAQQLGVYHHKLYAALRRAQIIGSKNIACTTHEREGYFKNEHRGFQVPGTTIMRQYTVSTVTAKGMSLLQDVIDSEIKEGRELRIGHTPDSRSAGAG